MSQKKQKPKTTREERGRMILEATFDPNDTTGRKVEGSIEEGFTVTNSKGGTHTVELLNEDEGQCSCMDFAFGHGRWCKHIYAAFFLSQSERVKQNEEPLELSAYEMY